MFQGGGKDIGCWGIERGELDVVEKMHFKEINKYKLETRCLTHKHTYPQNSSERGRHF
jgi:hypothetical protein